MAIEATLKELAELLYGHNYAVFLRLYRMPPSPGAGVEGYVTQALGPTAVVGGSAPATAQEMVAEVEGALRYVGDSTCGPRPSALRSKKYRELLGHVLTHVERATTGAELIVCFWLKEGHPAYPVFWDFAYVVAGPLGAEVFMGSSSD